MVFLLCFWGCEFVVGWYTMASKRQRGNNSRSSQAHDHSRFVSAEASERFHNILAGKTFVLEKGLRPDETQDGEMGIMVADGIGLM